VQATLVQRRPVGGREETAVVDTAATQPGDSPPSTKKGPESTSQTDSAAAQPAAGTR
jgi:hypothetical protein